MPSLPPSGSSPAPSWALAPDCPRAGPFLLGPELGAGTMGRVCEAWDPNLARRVAVKVLWSQDRDRVSRFIHEARHQAKVRHPNICQVYQFSAEPPFIAMELVAGRMTLMDLPLDLPVETKVRLMADAAAGVHAAHLEHLVHRDLKPGNILVAPQPDGSLRALVADFGLAMDWTRLGHSLTYRIAGTPAFMAPEQALGEDPTPAGDVYSLGATLFALLTGGPPFEATSIGGLLAQQVEKEPPRLRQKAPGLPKDLETILLKAMDPEPRRRYESAFALEEDLRRFLAHEPVHARRPSLAYRMGRWVRRHRALAATLGLSILILGSLLAWNGFILRRGRRQAELATRFGLEVKDLENHLRLHRLMPPHDLRPVEAQVEARIRALREEMKALGNLAEGPGRYALGRAHLAKGDPKAALEELKAAEAAGFRNPDTAYALGMAYARRFRQELERAYAKDSSEAGVAEARKNHFPALGQPALEAFARARGQATEHPAYGEAEMAWLMGDLKGCLAKCREAYVAVPWMVEARRLESFLLREESNRLDREGRMEARNRALKEAWTCLEAALTLAPSDEISLGDAMNAQTQRSTQQSAAGGMSEEPFLLGEELYARALLLRPDAPDILRKLVDLRMRWVVFMLARGRDPRAKALETLEQARALEGDPEGRTSLANLRWMLGAAQFFRGEDPRPMLAGARARFPGNDPYGPVEVDLVEARYLLARGLDPERCLASALASVDRSLQAHPEDAYLLQILGETHTLRAQWAQMEGRDPSEAIGAGLQALESCLAKAPTLSYAWFDKATLETTAAEWAFSRGRDPFPALARAHRAARKSLELRPDFHRASWVRAKALLLEARIRAARNEDPAPILNQAANELARARSINPASFLLQEALAEVEGLRGRGDRAEAAARAGLRVKADAAGLWTRLAEAHLLQARTDPARADFHQQEAARARRVQAALRF